MSRSEQEKHIVSRRAFLKGMRWTPLLFLPAPLSASPFQKLPKTSPNSFPHPTFSDFRFTPRYPAKSPLEDVLRLVAPGSDEYRTEKYAFEIASLLNDWGRSLTSAPPALDVLARFAAPSIQSSSLGPARENKLRSAYGIEVFRRQFAPELVPGRERFLQQFKNYFSAMPQMETAELEIVGIDEIVTSPLTVKVDIRYDFVSPRNDGGREQRTGQWRTQWSQNQSTAWQAVRWEATEETLGRARGPVFIDVTAQALGETTSYREQLRYGVDLWRTILDGACGIDVYGNNGVAVGDFNNDGLDDIYVSQPAGLPNRLYRNRGDGTFEDVTDSSGLGVLDSTACALFADFDNRGAQDLLVVCGSGPLLFLNEGNGKFSLKRDTFKFARPPEGTFTHAAVADYDRDGRLDIYFCLYSYYLGLDQYHYPVPYFDARNGPPNFLFHNDGGMGFRDQTQAAGLNVDNDRYSFACAWGDCNSDGWPDLYVSNDFGRSNLYRNKGNGTFESVATEARVEDVGAGMSACWFDFDGDGNQDIYAANMWSAAGLRVSAQKQFQEKGPEEIRSLYRRHARGNSLYRNRGNGQFENGGTARGVEMGRWSWCSDAWDFDHDGWPDLYIANGYISGADPREVSSFFWRQLVAKSPNNSNPSVSYERGWNAINELIRSDASWSGPERNNFYLNNRDGTFSDVSGAVGLDFPEDSRSFALADLDHDGRLEIILKNRNSPQLRILHNVMPELGQSLAFRLHGKQSNRDAIGAAVTVEAQGHRQTKYLQAGSGFLSQHSKEIFFGLGQAQEKISATVRWPSGLLQAFQDLPANHSVEIEEGSPEVKAAPFAARSFPPARHSQPQPTVLLPASTETWLIDPLSAPDVSLPDLSGNQWSLQSFRGGLVLLNFWASAASTSLEQLQLLKRACSSIASSGIHIAAINVDNPNDALAVRSAMGKEDLPFSVLLASEDISGVYNIIYRYLFDRRRDLSFPASFLVNQDGMIVKLYQGLFHPERLLEDVRSMPQTPEERTHKALPFEGRLYQASFQRNAFTHGVALFQHGYLGHATAAFLQVIATRPADAEAHYNLGTLYLHRDDFQNAREHLDQAVKLRPNYPEAWNNLGMIAAKQNQLEEAVRSFQQSLLLRPSYTVALLNLGNLYRRQRNFQSADEFLHRALEREPENAEVQYSLGMLYAQKDQIDLASQFLQRAIGLRPDYSEARNNFGVLLVRKQRYPEAEREFRACIQAVPNFDQAYLNLARLYVMLNDKEKARHTLQELLHLQPAHKLAQQALEMLE